MRSGYLWLSLGLAFVGVCLLAGFFGAWQPLVSAGDPGPRHEVGGLLLGIIFLVAAVFFWRRRTMRPQ